jgi:hypothetical protein
VNRPDTAARAAPGILDPAPERTRGDSFNAWPTPTAPAAPRRKAYGAPVRVWQGLAAYWALPPRSYATSRDFGAPDGRVRALCIPVDARRPFEAFAKAGPHLGRRLTWSEVPRVVQGQIRASFLGRYCPREDA